MKRVAYFILGFIIIAVLLFYLINFWGFAKGVNEDAKQKDEINTPDSVILNDSTVLKIQKVDSVQ